MAFDRSFKDIKDAISSALVDTTRTTGQIANEDLAFQRSSNPSIVPLLEQQSSRLLHLTRRLIRTATSGTDITAPQVSDPESVEDNWMGFVDVFDNLLEKADACLDEYTGVVRKLSPTQEERMKNALPSANVKKRPTKAFHGQYIPKPQLLFANVPTNDQSAPFKPLLLSKPHAITPLEECFTLAPSEEGPLQYKHPYETEIKQSRYPPATHVKSDPIPYLPFEETQATFVDTPEAMMSMLHELRMAKEIAVDLEHHDEHSYIGIVSLMQISTRDKDWIVDTLKPWRRELQILNEVFADPRILKVLHGASMDMIWLQRDLGLYIVGLFDTFHASRSLGYPKKSLAYLLKRFANFDAAKQYQMADWRIRPLPEEMFDYARSDTHFLLYIYDNLRNELIQNSNTADPEGDLVEAVLEHSKEEALQRYEVPIYDAQRGLGASGWYHMLSRNPALFSREQFAVFKAVHQWRDDVARQEDESVHHIMSKNALFNIAREMPLDMPSLLGCSHPMSPVFRRRMKELLGLVKAAKEMGTSGREMKDELADLSQFVRPFYALRPRKDVTDRRDADTAPAKEEGRAAEGLVLNDLLARAESSDFWGSTIREPSKSPRGPEVQLYNGNLRLALPLPQLSAEIFEDSKSTRTAATEVPQTDASARAEHQYIKDRGVKEDDIFVVKQAGGARKRKAADLLNAPEPKSPKRGDGTIEEADGEAGEMDVQRLKSNTDDQIEVNRQPQTTAAQKHLRRMERKRLKREKSLREAAGVAGNQEYVASNREYGELEAFDYSNAQSLLHGSREHGNDMKGGVNPYSKSRDAPKGMRKTKKDVGGRSLTFRV